MEATLQDKIAAIIEPSLNDMGYNLVQIRFLENGRHTLQIMVERTDNASMKVDDCADVSRTVSTLLDVEDPIQGAYVLEVSSPGIDRPLTKMADFEKYNGFDAKLETKLPIDGRRRFKGKLQGVNEEKILLKTEEGEATIPFSEIRSAKLLLTDALLKKAASQQ